MLAREGDRVMLLGRKSWKLIWLLCRGSSALYKSMDWLRLIGFTFLKEESDLTGLISFREEALPFLAASDILLRIFITSFSDCEGWIGSVKDSLTLFLP